MLTHRPLFVGTAQECIAQILFKPIPSPQTVFSRAPDDLSAIAMRLLARERAERYQTAEDDPPGPALPRATCPLTDGAPRRLCPCSPERFS